VITFFSFVALCHSQPRLSRVNIRSRQSREVGVISPVQQKVSVWLADSSLVPIMDLPPKDPEDDEDENEEDDEDDGEEEEPGVIREPDEC
jgi:hypothetical protein